MQHIEAGPRAVAIWLSGEPIPNRHAIPKLVQNILSHRGFDPWPTVEAACYTGGEETLILAHPGQPRPVGFYFPDRETLRSAALTCPNQTSSLYRLKHGFFLTVPADRIPFALCEHGTGHPLSPLWEVHGKEQGLCLADGSALAELKCFFSTSEI